MHVEALAAVQRLVGSRWFGWSSVLEDATRICGRGSRGWMAGVDDGDIAPDSVVLGL